MTIPPFAQDLAERAGKSFVQGFLVGGAFSSLATPTITGIHWIDALNVGGGMAVLSVATSLLSLKVGNSGTASLTNAVEPTK